ncbi:MAG: protein kinase [Pseudomonadota bacterium]
MDIPGFQIKKTIGKGGMATAYLAVEEAENRIVALKVLKLRDEGLEPREQKTQIERFKREGQLVASMAHPNIVKVYGVGSTERLLYLSMEYLGGGDLKTRLHSGLSQGVALDIVESIAEALGYAHARNIIHRDVKPTNILFRRDGVPLLSDFGIAKTTSDDVTDLTTIGMLLGSPTYMSPEQAEGRELDPRTDLYSLGVILYEMLTGMPPFVDPSALKVIVKHAQEPVPPLPNELDIYQPLIDGLLEKDRDRRIQSAGDLLEQIDELRDTHADVIEGLPPLGISRKSGELTQIVDGVSSIVSIGLEQDRVMLPIGVETTAGLEQLTNSDKPTNEFVRLLQTDPGLAVQMMRVANSRYYRQEGIVSELPEALANLGPRALEHALAFSAASKLFFSRADQWVSEELSRIRRSACRVATLSRLIAEQSGLNPRRAYACGLLHNVGALPILVWAHGQGKCRDNPGLVRKLLAKGERRTGLLLMETWQFSEFLLGPLRESLNEQAPSPTSETRLLRFAIALDSAYQQNQAVSEMLVGELLDATGFSGDVAELGTVIERANVEFASLQFASAA